MRYLKNVVAVIFLCVIAFLAEPGFALTNAPEYQRAQSEFQRLTIDQRIRLQVLLTAAGYWSAVPNVDFSVRLFYAIKRFETNEGFEPNGYVENNQILRLFAVGGPFLDRWAFRVFTHPQVGGSIWVPTGLNLSVKQTDCGLQFSPTDGNLQINFCFFPATNVSGSMESISDFLIKNGYATTYSKIIKDSFFVISSSNGTRDSYIRYHKFQNGVLGFSAYWNTNGSDDHIDRAVTLMSASLWSSMSGARFTSPFTVKNKDENGFAGFHLTSGNGSTAKVTEIPLERSSGTFQVPVLLNDSVRIKFTVDSGAADVSLPLDVVLTLMRAGTIVDSDIIGKQKYILADGSVSEQDQIRIKKLRVGDLELQDVIGSASPMKGTPLLGQSFLSRFKNWSIDNERGVLKLEAVLPPGANKTDAVSSESFAPIKDGAVVAPPANISPPTPPQPTVALPRPSPVPSVVDSPAAPVPYPAPQAAVVVPTPSPAPSLVAPPAAASPSMTPQPAVAVPIPSPAPSLVAPPAAASPSMTPQPAVAVPIPSPTPYVVASPAASAASPSLRCGFGTMESGGQCVIKTCPSGKRLMPTGVCKAAMVPKHHAKSAPRREKQEGGCTNVGGANFC